MNRDPNGIKVGDAQVCAHGGTLRPRSTGEAPPMATSIPRAAPRPWHVGKRRRLLLLAVIAAFVAIALLRFSMTTDTHAAIAALLVIPIIIIGIEFDTRTSVLAAIAASVAFVAWHLRLDPSPLSTLDAVSHVVELLGIGVLVGWLAGARRRELAISHAVLDALPEPASVQTPSGRYLLVNPALERMLATPNEQLIGQPTGYGRPLDVMLRVEEADRRVIETRRPVELEVDVDIPGIGPMATRTIKSPVLDERGTVVAIVTVAHDISERVAHERTLLRRAAEARAEYQRATGEYAQLVRHRLANPLTVIACAGESLRTEYSADPAKRELLADLISEQVARLASIDLRAEQVGLEEHDLQGVPAADLEAIERTAQSFAQSIRQPFDRREDQAPAVVTPADR
jgi:PAS domain-containing protein